MNFWCSLVWFLTVSCHLLLYIKVCAQQVETQRCGLILAVIQRSIFVHSIWERCWCQYTFQKVDPKSVLFLQEKHSEVLNSRWLTAGKPLHAKSRNNGISFSYFPYLLICQIFLFTTARTDTFRCLVLSDCQSKVVRYSTDAHAWCWNQQFWGHSA